MSSQTPTTEKPVRPAQQKEQPRKMPTPAGVSEKDTVTVDEAPESDTGA